MGELPLLNWCIKTPLKKSFKKYRKLVNISAPTGLECEEMDTIVLCSEERKSYNMRVTE